MRNHQQRQQHREEIMEFCRNFINGDNKHLHDVIDNYRHLFSQIDIKQLNLTQETFDITFKNICGKLFDTRPDDADNKGYIISLLGFALTLNEYHLSSHDDDDYSWFHSEILIESLVDVLENINFQLKELTIAVEPTYYYCIIL